MRFGKKIRRKILDRLGYMVINRNFPGVFIEDGIVTYHNHSFTEDPRFIEVFDRGNKPHDKAFMIRWRLHIALWTAAQAINRPGAFVECGTNTGFMMTAIMTWLDWNKTGRTAYLFDTFAGLDPEFTTEAEKAKGRLERYSDQSEASVRRNFEEFSNVEFVVGTIPKTLEDVKIDEVAFLHIDMNAVIPEIAAFRHFWPRMSPGGFVLLDDYAFRGYEAQHKAFTELGEELGFMVMTLPTGQGLVQKPIT